MDWFNAFMAELPPPAQAAVLGTLMLFAIGGMGIVFLVAVTLMHRAGG
ncbi:MAG: hypothetical protein WD208_03580 [Dehalococcoidia bacterium]